MLPSLYSKLQKRPPKYIYAWNKMIYDAKKILHIHTDRLELINPILNTVTEKLKSTVLYIDVKGLDTLENDEARYIAYIQKQMFYIEAYLKNLFNGTVNGMWCKSASTFEICVPVHSPDPLDNLPMNKPWEEGWDKVKCLSINHHDSIELSYNLNNTLNFTMFKPSIFIYSIDVCKFVFKYYKYWKSKNGNVNVDEYVYKELYRPLIHDLFNIWVLNITNRIVNFDDIETMYQQSSEIGNINSSLDLNRTRGPEINGDIDLLAASQISRFVPNSLRAGINDIYGKVYDLSNNEIQLNDFISIPFLCIPEKKNPVSLIEAIKYNIDNYRTYNLRQYKHLGFLLELPLIKLFCDIRKRNTSVIRDTYTTDITFRKYFEILQNDKVSNYYTSPILKNYVENIISDMTSEY